MRLSLLLACLCLLTAGEVITLDKDNFGAKLASGNWLIEFYTPWCRYCKNFAPTWKAVAQQLQGKVSVAQVDCTENSGLCNSLEIRGYPTIKAKADGQTDFLEYNVARDLKSIVSYGLNLANPTISDITSIEELDRNAVVFVLYYKDDSDKRALEAAAERHKVNAAFAATRSEDALAEYGATAAPALLVLKSGTYVRYPGNMGDADMLRAWVASQKLELLPTLGEGGLAAMEELEANNRPVLLAVLDTRNAIQADAVREAMLSAARAFNNDGSIGDAELRHRFQFATIKGDLFEPFLSQTFSIVLEQLPTMVVWDIAGNTYFLQSEADESVRGKPITQASITAFAQAVARGDAPKHGGYINQFLQTIRIIFYQLRQTMSTNPLIIGMIVIFPLFVIYIVRSSLASERETDEADERDYKYPTDDWPNEDEDIEEIARPEDKKKR